MPGYRKSQGYHKDPALTKSAATRKMLLDFIRSIQEIEEAQQVYRKKVDRFIETRAGHHWLWRTGKFRAQTTSGYCFSIIKERNDSKSIPSTTNTSASSHQVDKRRD